MEHCFGDVDLVVRYFMIRDFSRLIFGTSFDNGCLILLTIWLFRIWAFRDTYSTVQNILGIETRI